MVRKMPEDETNEEDEQERIYATMMLETRVAVVNMQRQDDFEFVADDVEARVHNEYIIIERKATDTMLAIIPAANVMIVTLMTREFEATVEVDEDGAQIGAPDPDDVPAIFGTAPKLGIQKQG